MVGMRPGAGEEQAVTNGVLLVISGSEEPAKKMESHLRNAGHPLRCAWAADLDELSEILTRSPPDLVFGEIDSAVAPAEALIAACRRLRPDLPVILIGQRSSGEAAGAAMALGARDLVGCGNSAELRHLEQVVVREFIAHRRLRELRLTREQLKDFQSRHRQLTEDTGDAIAHVQEGIVVNANRAFAHLLGIDDGAQLAGTPLIDLVEAEQQTKVKERLRAVLKGKHVGEPLELALRGNQGRVDVKAKLILGVADGEQVIEMLVRGEPPPDRAAPSSGGSRADFAQAIGEPVGANEARAAVLLHADGMQELEARIGPVDAEEVFQRVVDGVHARLDGRDRSFKFSSDELGLLIRRANFNEIEQFGEQLRGALSGQIYATREHEAQMTLSIAVYPLGPKVAVENLLSQLVEEARKLSRSGGNAVAIVGAAAKEKLAEREEARRAAQVKKALEEDRLKLAYQSIASLEGESRGHFDVLVRLLDESNREYHASEFLPAAQKFGLLGAVDRWVTGRVLEVLAKRGKQQVLFVKLGEETLKEGEQFLEWLKQRFAADAPAPNELVFELPELALQNHIRKAKTLTQGLRELGIGVAIERFGVGSHSAQLINFIPAQYLKFDASFTRDFAKPEVQKRLAALVEVAKQQKIKTIVSHVEDANVMARLWQIGVNFVQGYHVQEPEVVMLAGEAPRR